MGSTSVFVDFGSRREHLGLLLIESLRETLVTIKCQRKRQKSSSNGKKSFYCGKRDQLSPSDIMLIRIYIDFSYF